jgi:hypothetical protein
VSDNWNQSVANKWDPEDLKKAREKADGFMEQFEVKPMIAVRGSVPPSQITRHGDNYLDKPFKVGDRVELVEKGVQIYGHYPEMVLGRKATVVHIPTERWNGNCITVKWDDDGELSTLGCWSFEWIADEKTEGGDKSEQTATS